jgi:hypothetical protein
MNFLHIFLLLIVCYPHYLCANAGALIFLLINYFALILSFIPIIFIEYIILKKYIISLSKGKLLQATIQANILSAVCEIPFILFLTTQRDKILSCRGPLSALVLFSVLVMYLLVTFIISYWIEYFFFRSLMKNKMDTSTLKNVVLKANIASYLFMAVVIVVVVIKCFN